MACRCCGALPARLGSLVGPRSWSAWAKSCPTDCGMPRVESPRAAACIAFCCWRLMLGMRGLLRVALDVHDQKVEVVTERLACEIEHEASVHVRDALVDVRGPSCFVRGRKCVDVFSDQDRKSTR